jgi:hypothetical protein
MIFSRREAPFIWFTSTRASKRSVRSVISIYPPCLFMEDDLGLRRLVMTTRTVVSDMFNTLAMVRLSRPAIWSNLTPSVMLLSATA